MILTIVVGWWTLGGAILGVAFAVLRYLILVYNQHLVVTGRVPADREHVAKLFSLDGLHREFQLMTWTGRIKAVVKILGSYAFIPGVAGLAIENVLRFF